MGCINSTNKPLYALKRDDVFNVSVVRVQSDQPMSLSKHGFLEITPHDLIFIAAEQEPVAWALQHLRRYGLTGNVFSFEAGRRCPNGPGVYTFRCCNADQFYAKFQRCINSMSVVGSNSSVHPSQLFGRLESHQPHTNNYLEPTSVPIVSSFDDRLVMPDSLSNNSNDFNLNSPDSVQSSSLNAEIIHFPSAPSYSNVSPNAHSSSNIYMEQPIRIINAHNNNISSHEIIDSSNANDHKSVLKTLLKSSSLDMPPDECAPMLHTNDVEAQKLYENIDANISKSISTPQNTCNNVTERFYANVEFLPRLYTHIGQSKSFQLDFVVDQQQPTSTNTPIVNYIILDLDQPRSPSQCSPKRGFGSAQSFSESGGNIASFQKDELPPSSSALSCGSSTMPKGSTISDESSMLSSKMESSGSYTRIDFLKTFALMNSSTNYTDFDLENDQEESRITRHSKFVRKAYSISE